LNAVSCPRANSCYAVGGVLTKADTDQSFIEHWNGKIWSVMSSPPYGGTGNVVLTGISCPNPSSCLAIGLDTKTDNSASGVVERWNGAKWTIRALPNPTVGSWSDDGPGGVSCPSPSGCFVVSAAYRPGGFYTFVQYWNGARWTIIPSPNITSDTELSGVSCPGPTSCFAVGRYFDPSTKHTFAEHWNGSRWTASTTPNPTSQAELFNVSCPASNSCFAVGDSSTASTTTTLVEQWNGTKWVIDASPNPPGAGDALLGNVSCFSTQGCFAVGDAAKNSDTFPGAPLIERWS